jgi:hypothetical protein
MRRRRQMKGLALPGKGGKQRELPIPAPLGYDLDAYLDRRRGGDGRADAVAVRLAGQWAQPEV